MSDKAKVALVNMPFSYSKFPSIQLGTLSALLKSKGTRSRLPSSERTICLQDRRAPL